MNTSASSRAHPTANSLAVGKLRAWAYTVRLHHLAASPLLTGVAEPYTMTLIEHIPLSLQPQRDPGPFQCGRVCRHAHCLTRLNRNNPGPLCHRHLLLSMPAAERMDEAA